MSLGNGAPRAGARAMSLWPDQGTQQQAATPYGGFRTDPCCSKTNTAKLCHWRMRLIQEEKIEQVTHDSLLDKKLGDGGMDGIINV